MAVLEGLTPDDTVYVPAYSLNLTNAPTALVAAKVVRRERKSVLVSYPGRDPAKVAASKVHRSVGVLLLRIGDLVTEDTLLDPLAKSVLQFLRLLLPDDMVRSFRVRSREEMAEVWRVHHALYTHVILVAHGGPDHLTYGVGGPSTAVETLETFTASGDDTPRYFLSLACQTGRKEFADPFSQADVCRALIAPQKSVHGAVAAQFAQRYFGAHFLEGRSAWVAFKHAHQDAPGDGCFGWWEDGYRYTG